MDLFMLRAQSETDQRIEELRRNPDYLTVECGPLERTGLHEAEYDLIVQYRQPVGFIKTRMSISFFSVTPE